MAKKERNTFEALLADYENRKAERARKLAELEAKKEEALARAEEAKDTYAAAMDVLNVDRAYTARKDKEMAEEAVRMYTAAIAKARSADLFSKAEGEEALRNIQAYAGAINEAAAREVCRYLADIEPIVSKLEQNLQECNNMIFNLGMHSHMPMHTAIVNIRGSLAHNRQYFPELYPGK